MGPVCHHTVWAHAVPAVGPDCHHTVWAHAVRTVGPDCHRGPRLSPPTQYVLWAQTVTIQSGPTVPSLTMISVPSPAGPKFVTTACIQLLKMQCNVADNLFGRRHRSTRVADQKLAGTGCFQPPAGIFVKKSEHNNQMDGNSTTWQRGGGQARTSIVRDPQEDDINRRTTTTCCWMAPCGDWRGEEQQRRKAKGRQRTDRRYRYLRWQQRRRHSNGVK